VNEPPLTVRRATDTDLPLLARYGFALALGSSSLMLSASSQNAPARHLFERAGLRPTMVEMRIELAA
jgi:RimJ/RimL family protein N-acetyltransferase